MHWGYRAMLLVVGITVFDFFVGAIMIAMSVYLAPIFALFGLTTYIITYVQIREWKEKAKNFQLSETEKKEEGL